MRYSFVTYLGTDNFLPGVLTLNASLQKYNKKYDLVVLVSDLVSSQIVDLLDFKKIKYKLVKQIKNPQKLGADERNFKYMFTKLRMFEMVEFDKIVYLDADMLICKNIEMLFNAPHMSGVIAGKLYPGNESWSHVNAGFLVVEPGQALFNKLCSSISHLPSDDGSDQGFLHSFYEDWPSDKNLHLDHQFNVPYPYIDEYCSSHNYEFSYSRKLLETNISIIHYWGRYKPWDFNIRSLKRKSTSKLEQALLLWWDTFLIAATDVYH